MSDIKLEPCPWCGGNAVLDMTDANISFVKCGDNDTFCFHPVPRVYGMSKAEACLLWNEYAKFRASSRSGPLPDERAQTNILVRKDDAAQKAWNDHMMFFVNDLNRRLQVLERRDDDALF